MTDIQPTLTSELIFAVMIVIIMFTIYSNLRGALRDTQASESEELTTEEQVHIANLASVNVQHAILEEAQEFRQRVRSEPSASDEDWDRLEDL